MRRRPFFEAVRALLPRSRAFSLVARSGLRLLFEGFSALPDDVRDEMEGVLLDYYPETTRAVDEWELAFRAQLTDSRFTASERRTVVRALWWLRYGNTTKEFMQKVLGLFIPGARVEDNTPVMDITGLTQRYRSVNGNRDMYCGGERAVCSEGTLAFLYESVNGAQPMCCGNRRAMNGRCVLTGDDVPSVLANDSARPWDIPTSLDHQSLCFFVSGDIARAEGGEVVGIQWLSVEEKWRSVIEYIVLALKPVHTTAVLWIHYI